MHDNYDVKGGVHRIEQRRHSVDHLAFLPCPQDRDSFDVEFSPSGQVVQRTNYTFEAQIYGSKRFIYGGRGELVRTLEFEASGGRLGNTDFRFDSEGNCVGWTRFDSSGALTRLCVKHFTGKLLVHSVTSNASGVPVAEQDFQYERSTLVKSLRGYYGLDGSLSETWISLYNSQGWLIETFGLNEKGGALGDGRYTYEYDTDGRKMKNWSFNDCSDDNLPNAVTVFEYQSDEVGNWVKRTAFHRFLTDSRWTKKITNRKLTYFSST
jgi:hypothetical protein